jgi:methylase of polypeptide subunit release factors
VEWETVPDVLRPSTGGKGGLAHDKGRVTRKRWQLESLYVVVRRVVGRLKEVQWANRNACVADVGSGSQTGGVGGRPLRVVDFGCGSGNSALVLAALLPECHFTLVDLKGGSIDIGRARMKQAGLSNVRWWTGDVKDYKEPVPKHARTTYEI